MTAKCEALLHKTQKADVDETDEKENEDFKRETTKRRAAMVEKRMWRAWHASKMLLYY
jgi:hypothetical protein